MLFVHGAGGFDEDRSLAQALAGATGGELDYPRLPDDDMSYDGWAAVVRDRLAALGSADLAIGHSLGGSVLVKLLGERRPTVRKAVLLAIPYWGPGGWDVAEYAYGGDEPDAALALHHCRDDGVVPFDHLALNAADLPSATVTAHDAGGHQLDGLAELISGSW